MNTQVVDETNLSLPLLLSVLSGSTNAEWSMIDERVLKATINDRACLVSIVGGSQIRIFSPSALPIPQDVSLQELVALANDVNSDLAWTLRAYVSDEADLCFLHSIYVDGGVNNWNIGISLLAFLVECTIVDEGVVRKRFTAS